MIKRLLKSVREFKKDALLTPFFVVLEVVMEVIIPMVMALLIDKGIDGQDMAAIWKYGIILVPVSYTHLQIAQEGAIQIFREPNAGMESVIVGVVGVLQFEVLEYRLKNEYNVEIIRENLPYEHVRWVENDEEDFDIKKLQLTSDTKIVEDLKGNSLLLFTSPWNITYATDHNENLRLADFSENA